MVIKVLVMTIRDDQVLQLGKEDRKQKPKRSRQVSNRFLFWHSRHQKGVSVFRIDSRTIEVENFG